MKLAAGDATLTCVVVANSTKSSKDWLPFFSKLNLMQHPHKIQRMGFGVELAGVPAE